MSYHVYGLADPETGRIRYVGQSRRVFVRYKEHASLKERNAALAAGRREKPRHRWLKGLAQRGLEPVLVILDALDATPGPFRGAPSEVVRLEALWIERLRDAGHPLLNEA